MKMLEEMNIFIEWQVPNSPETNLLDLGIWMAIQSYAEMLHKNKVMQADVLADSVEKAWDVLSSSVLTKVHERWKLVLKLILAGKGSNDLVSWMICHLCQNLMVMNICLHQMMIFKMNIEINM